MTESARLFMAVDTLPPTEPRSWEPIPRSGTDTDLALLVVRDGEASTYPLGLSGTLLIGRSQQAAVRIDHKSVSREHALLHLGASLRIEDLGSHNGTRVRDVPLKPGVPVEVFPDDVIDLGAVLLVLQYRRLEQRLRRSCDPAFFQLRVEEECERVANGGPEFAVCSVEVEGGLGTHAVQLLLASELTREDLITSGGPGKYEVLLCAVSPSDASRRIELLTQRLMQRNLRARTTFRQCPRDGLSVAELLGHAPPRSRPLKSAVRADFVVKDDAMRRVCRLLERVADSELSVLLLGETGVGKEVCAELVHTLSARGKRRMLRLNCAAIAETLLESELFGYERGAFSGAHADKPGLLESASGGTVFLDEIGDMPLATQIKLLRALESREVLRIGSRVPRAVDIRLISATHQDLSERITAGLFREDLYYRLNGISVLVPPLRERVDDIEPLARFFLARFQKPDREPPTLSTEAIDWLEAHSWPGNVRELRNVVERSLVLCDQGRIEPEHLPLDRTQSLAPVPQRPDSGRGGALRDELRSLERERIEAALRECQGNQRRTAEKLGISRGALLRRLEQLAIGRPRKGV
ncbi:MAG TPA: sigma 54-interacting transcriptional regulator [Polyangiaceae bacterium]